MLPSMVVRLDDETPVAWAFLGTGFKRCRLDSPFDVSVRATDNLSLTRRT